MTQLALSRARPARRSIISHFLHAVAIRRERTKLADLDDHLLEDIGIDRKTALKEANRSLWDAPANWRR